MERRIIFNFLFFFVSCWMSIAVATPITAEQARLNALSTISSTNLLKGTEGMNLSLVHVMKNSRIITAQSMPQLYVFNIGDGDGFIIMSGDDAAVPVLGYSEEGSFDPENIPINLQEWLEGYTFEIAMAQLNGYAGVQPVKVSADKHDISAMVKSKWGQRAPFNSQCVFNGELCRSGCVALAMSQILYYWASIGRDGITFRGGCTALPGYTTSSNHYEVDSLPALESFDWDHMTNTKPTTTVAIAAIAQLQRYCGQSVNMDYTPTGSGAHTSAIVFHDCFGYCQGGYKIYESYSSAEVWSNRIYNELDRGNPVMMSGYGTVGHAFVCDGYQKSTGKFHFNWGFVGSCDGWYAMDALTPGNYNFSESKSALIGVQPFGNLAYVLLSDDKKTATFYYDDQYGLRSGSSYILKEYENTTTRPWANTAIERVVFDDSFANAKPTSTANWFYGLSNLTTVENLQNLDLSSVATMQSMFRSCTSLSSINISSLDMTYVSSAYSMFDGCSNLVSITLPPSLKMIDDYMFNNCKALKEITIPKGVTQIVSNAFQHCSSLISVNIPQGVTLIGSNAFYYCTSLASVNIPEGVTTIGQNAFERCNSLVTANLSSTVGSIGTRAFSCSSLVNVIVGFDVPFEISSTSFPYRSQANLYVPKGSKDAFAAATYWKDFKNIIEWEKGSGDVNMDGSVSINDVTALIDYLLGSGDAFNPACADFWCDGTINMKDVTALIDYLLTGERPNREFTVNGVSFKMINVPGGTYTMGGTAEQGTDAETQEFPTHQATVNGFSIGETEVTQELWQAVMGSNPSRFTGDPQRPVERMTWDECLAFIAELNSQTGMTFRLPTEAEWEYAARGGNMSKGYKYAGSNSVDDVAWYDANAYDVGSSSPDYGTHPVKSKAPNELGLYGMSGNVWEICLDWYNKDYYNDSPSVNPAGPETGTQRVIRGGSWYGYASSCRVSRRIGTPPSNKYDYRGLRLAL